MEIELVNVHLAVLCLTTIAIVIADHDGIQYLFGKKLTLSRSRTLKLHYTVFVGLSLMLLTGGMLFYRMSEELLYYPPFYLKICMVLALFANSFVIGRLSKIASETPFAKLSSTQKTQLFISGTVSGISWIGAGVIGWFYL